jgi:hypothetical protein
VVHLELNVVPLTITKERKRKNIHFFRPCSDPLSPPRLLASLLAWFGCGW